MRLLLSPFDCCIFLRLLPCRHYPRSPFHAIFVYSVHYFPCLRRLCHVVALLSAAPLLSASPCKGHHVGVSFDVFHEAVLARMIKFLL